MGLKVLGGFLKALTLNVPKTQTRPTSVLLRRKLFDSFQDLQGTYFVDLCAGSGAMGIEAYSRGAQKVFLIESHKMSFKTLQENVSFVVKRSKSKPDIELSKLDCRLWLQKHFQALKHQTQSSFILYFDPPYEDEKLYFDVISEIQRQSFIGDLWIESDSLKGPSLEKLEVALGKGPCSKVLKHSSHFVAIWSFG